MNIAVFSDTFIPMNNGVVTHLIELYPELAKRGHSITLFVPRPGKAIDTSSIESTNLKIHFLSSVPFPLYNDYQLSLGMFSSSFKKIAEKIDLIHVHTPMTLGTNGSYLAKKFHIPLVNTFHAYFTEPEYFRVLYLHKIGLGQSIIVSKIMWSYARSHYNKADAIVVPSDQVKKYLMSGGIKKPIHVISNGIDLAKFAVFKQSTLEFFDLPDKYLLYVGRISYEKDIDTLVQAFAIFCKTNNDVDLVLIGKGPAYKEIRKLVSQEKLEKRVNFLGQIDHERLMSSNIYPNALAFVSTSKSETQGVCFLEAMAFGLPLVVVKAGGAYELARNTGIVCQPGDKEEIARAFVRLVFDQKLQKKFGEQSLKKVKEHSLDKTVAKMDQLYIELIRLSQKKI